MAVPNLGNPSVPNCQKVDNDYWSSEILACGSSGRMPRFDPAYRPTRSNPGQNRLWPARGPFPSQGHRRHLDEFRERQDLR